MIAGAFPPYPCPERIDIWREVAKVIEPKLRVRPSEWAAANIRLQLGDAPHAGPIDMDYMPWIREAIDMMFDNPGKKGVFCMKPSQIGWTYLMLALMLCYCVTDPGPMLYVIDRVDKTHKFYALFMRWVMDNPEIAKLLKSARQSPMPTIAMEGMELDFHTAGSEGGLTSTGRQRIFVDEAEASMEAYPKGRGDLIGAAKGRFPAYADSSELFVWGHPGSPDKDIDFLINTSSDKRTWVWDCPHCAGTVNPDWTCVHFGAADERDDAKLNAGSAVFRCPSCGEVISDAERMRATRSRRWQGGTGRFEAEGDESQPYIGVVIHRLSAPNVTLRSLAGDYIEASRAGNLRTFMNKTLGETEKPKAGMVTPDDVLKSIEISDREIILPGGNDGAHILVVGVDVQWPPENPTLYVVAEAFASTGFSYTVVAEKFRGWAPFMNWLSQFRVRRQQAGYQDWMTPLGAAIDCSNWTGETLNACRVEVTGHNGAIVPLVPVRFQAHMTSVVPAKLSHEAKRLDPLRPNIGLIELYDLHDDTWIARAVHRIQDQRTKMLARPPEDWVMQLTARIEVQKKSRHGWAETGTTWEKAQKKRQDDWLMCKVYAEVLAAIKFNLDQLHAMTRPTVQGPPPTTPREDERWLADPGDRWLGG